MKRIVRCLNGTWLTVLLCTAAVLCCIGAAQAEGDAQLGPTGAIIVPGPEPGLSMAVGGVGMNPTRVGTISVQIDGPVRAAYLYWAGGGEEDFITPVQTLELDGNEFSGVQIGVEHEIEDALAYRANVTTFVQNEFLANGPGLYTFDVEDPAPSDNLDRMHGASLFVIYVDPSDPTVYSVTFVDGADYAFRLFAPGPNAVTEPVTFNYAPESDSRTAKLAFIVGEAKPGRPDQYTITNSGGTTTVNNELASTDGPEWDTVMRDVTIPSGDTGTTVQLFSPTEFTDSDSMLWSMAALQIPLGPGTGACCFADGSCSEETMEDCVAAGGTFLGVDVSCSSTDCTGKCCLPDGMCELRNRVDCEADGGTFFSVFEDCTEPTNCPVPTGGCCLPSGACASLTEDECIAAGGQLWQMGVDCTFIECPGACCFTDGSCQFITQVECNNAGGFYQGDGMMCADVDCAEPTGACCLPDGTCEQLSEADCNAQGGQYQGDGSMCANVRCEGACCLPDGTCDDGVTLDECNAAGGEYQGLGSDCASAQCPDGACCLPDGSCQDNTSQPQCENNLGGEWQGLNSTCATVRCEGACCLMDGSCVDDLTKSECQAQNGSWKGLGSECINVRCEGACCLPDGSCAADQTVDECAAAGGDFMGLNSQCFEVDCTGACCLPDGMCIEDQTVSECQGQGGEWQGLNTTCASVDCIGACCLPSGSCIDGVTLAECNGQGGTFQGLNTTCATVRCEGACCLMDGTCVEDTTLQECFTMDGVYQGFGTTCADVDCPAMGACCLPDGTCVDDQTETECNAQGGVFQGPGTACAGVDCTGACCLPDGTCTPNLTAVECAGLGGLYLGPLSDCADCPPAGDEEPGCSPKGSLVVFSKVEIRWGTGGNLIQDTFLQLTNDFPDDVRLKLYFVNGDPPLPGTPNERPHPGWNWANNTVTLTADQPAYWSALTGLGGNGPHDPTFSPFTVLDPGFPPGRPDPEVPGERMLRGFILAWAINENGEEIRWNHLAGQATLVHYAKGYAWEYPTCAVRAGTGVAHGDPTGTPGVLNLDGSEYAKLYGELLTSFQAVGGSAFSGPRLVTNETDVTLHPVDTDLRQETDGPVTTKAHYNVWNQNETKLSGAFRCITCWDQSLLSSYGVPNHFFITTLQTEVGKARIDGIASQLCDEDVDGDGVDDVVSQPAALLGLRAHFMSMDAGAEHSAAGTIMHGMGEEGALIRYDIVGPPPELEDVQSLDELFRLFNELGYDIGDTK